MGDEKKESKDEISIMFTDNNEHTNSDEELALHIMHRFNIDRETIKTMPAFDKILKPLFLEDKEK
jgi:hypothetical protein